jgi:rod shape-determining protein MreC
METAPGRRSALLLAAVVGLQVLLLAFQVRRREGGPRLLSVWVAEAYAPAARWATTTVGWCRQLWRNYLALRGAREENQRLRAQMAALQLQLNLLAARAAEADRLSRLLDFRRSRVDLPVLAARVISASPAASARVIYIDRGALDGVQRDMGVVTPDGVVGKILEVYPSSAQVLMITDRLSGVGALLADTRTQGVVRGTGGPYLVLDYIVSDEPVHPGQRVVTSGLDRIYPKDLPVGTVVSCRPSSPFQVIEVRPAARLDRLEEVFVLLSAQASAPPDQRAR